MPEITAPEVVGIGELLWDILPSGPRLGGTVANFAVFSARLGNRAVLVSSVGDDEYGRTARGILAQPNLDLRQLQFSADHSTGTVEVTLSADNQPSYVIPANVAWDFIRFTPTLRGAAPGANAVCFGTLGQRHEVSRSTIRGFVAATAPECVRVFDINIRMPDCTPEVLHWSMAHATIIKASDEELPLAFSFLSELGFTRPPVTITPETAAHALLEYFPNCKLVATTLGAEGSLVTSRRGNIQASGVSHQGGGYRRRGRRLHCRSAPCLPARRFACPRWPRPAIFVAVTSPGNPELRRCCQQSLSTTSRLCWALSESGLPTLSEVVFGPSRRVIV